MNPGGKVQIMYKIELELRREKSDGDTTDGNITNENPKKFGETKDNNYLEHSLVGRFLAILRVYI